MRKEVREEVTGRVVRCMGNTLINITLLSIYFSSSLVFTLATVQVSIFITALNWKNVFLKYIYVVILQVSTSGL